jgi:heterodisulfide reductase subunit B
MEADCVVTPCPSCLSNLKHAKHRMEDPEFKAKVDELLDEPCPELPDTYSVLQVIVEKLSMKEIAAKVKKPLTGLKVACYYGCLMVRPPKVMNFDDYENPMSLDNLLIALGAEVVPFPLKTECCGASIGIVDKDITASLSGRILERAKQFGANCVVAACPLCQMNLDLRQFQAEKAMGQKFDLPIFYYTQLLGLALGLDDSVLMMNKLVVNPNALLKSLGAQTEKTEKAEPKAKAKKAEADEAKSDEGAAS